jgi:hypothetical protein
LVDGQTITQDQLDIDIIANATGNFHSWRLEWGPGTDPGDWTTLVDDSSIPVTAPTNVASLDLTGMPYQQITLHLYMQSDNGGYAERKIHLNLDLPTPTITPTEIPTPTPSLTPFPSPTDTLTDTPIPSDTPLPSETPTP